MTDLDTLYMREVAKAYEQPPEMSIWAMLPGMIWGAIVWIAGYVGWRVARIFF